MTSLDQLLVVQDHDTTLDQLRHRRATLPEREVVERAEALLRQLEGPLTDIRARHDLVARDVKRLEDEASAAAAKAKEVDDAMYSGTITSAKELQAMQQDLEQIRRHQRALEDRELEFMEQQEAVDEELAALDAQVGAAEADITAARVVIAERESAIDAEIAAELVERERVTAGISPDLVALYERCRAQNRGAGVAKLVGHTCQGCRLTIPASEVDRIRHAEPDAPVSHCDNCGAILVPSH
jgi:predicted  nucleic acid-binding Zn-ribbon protein